jgi:hypothetical protein
MYTISIQKTIETSEAQRILGLERSSIYRLSDEGCYKKISKGVYDRASFMAYVSRRIVKKNEMHERILDAVRSHFAKHGEFLTYRPLMKKTKISSTSTVRYYLNRMQKRGLIELYKGHIYLPGLREKIMKLAREEYSR